MCSAVTRAGQRQQMPGRVTKAEHELGDPAVAGPEDDPRQPTPCGSFGIRSPGIYGLGYRGRAVAAPLTLESAPTPG